MTDDFDAERAPGVIRARAFQVCEPWELAKILSSASSARLVVGKDGKPEIRWYPH